MVAKRKAAPAGATSSSASARSSAAGALQAATAPMRQIAGELRRWTDSVLGVAGPAADMALNLAQARTQDPGRKEVIAKAGGALRRAREAAGMTTEELGQAIGLSDDGLLDQAEGGAVALPFDVILRLAGVLGRHDPTTFALKLTRSYNPELWKALDDLGVGRLVVQAGRERELANLYRASDAARRLSDEDFAQVLQFVSEAFELAVAFRAAAPSGRRSAPVGKRPSSDG